MAQQDFLSNKKEAHIMPQECLILSFCLAANDHHSLPEGAKITRHKAFFVLCAKFCVLLTRKALHFGQFGGLVIVKMNKQG